MAKPLPVNELLRLACCYAEAYLESAVEASLDDATKQSDQQVLDQLAAYRHKRWGITEREAAIERQA